MLRDDIRFISLSCDHESGFVPGAWIPSSQFCLAFEPLRESWNDPAVDLVRASVKIPASS